MVGKGVLLECLDHEAISEVLIIGRRPIGLKHQKLKELIHKDFGNFSEVKNQLAVYDACFFCLGVSAAGMKEEQYTKITYDYTLALAKTLFQINPKMTFNYVSGEGTDSTEKGRSMWARVKDIKAIAPNSVVDTTQIGLAMINSVQTVYSTKVLKPRDIILLSR
jgi:hypothetical protein